jgi:hypothetical protein
MANLNADLNSYLSRSASSSTLSSKLSAFKLPTLDSIKSLGSGVGPAVAEDEEPFLGVQSDAGGGVGRWQAATDGCLPSLSKKQRIIGFMTSLVLGFVCFGLAVSFLPMLVLNPRKFSLLFSLGSVFTISR